MVDNLLDSPNTTTYTYNSVGNLDDIVWPKGVVHQYGYNELNRLGQLDVTDSLGALLRRYMYTLNSTGQRTGVVESAGNPVAQRRRVADGSPCLELEALTENAAKGMVWDDLGRAREVFLWNGKPISKRKFLERLKKTYGYQ